MKYLFLFMILIMLAGCAGSQRIMVRNCQPIQGTNLWDCEEIPTKDIEPHNR